jgi:hypothetical protein
MMMTGVLGVAALLGGGAVAEAAVPAATTVTIRADGTDLSGQVRSPAPNRCANNRLVVVFRQVGPRGPAGGADIRFATDTSELQGGVGRWSTGTTGTPGKFYAKVFKKPGQCKGDESPTVQAVSGP